MSDRLTPEFIEAIKQRDTRFREIDLGLDVEAQLRGNQPLGRLMARLRDDLESALTEFAFANCADTVLMQGLQARVYRCIYAMGTFNEIIQVGRFAQQSVVSEDVNERERDD